jgi:glycosyltransferase involved in cell wall biosynthesis
MTLWAVLPGGIDDPAAPSGGNLYDRMVLSLVDRDVHEIAVAGSWPEASAAARRALADALAEIPDKSDVLLDGLVACGVPELLEPHAQRLRFAVLVHLPLSDETGLSRSSRSLRQGLERRTLHLVDTVIATSEAAAAHISEMHDLPGVEVAAPGVDRASSATPSQDGHRLLCVAAVTHRKGQDLLVAALQDHLADLHWNCTFVGALREPVPHTDPRIRFTGPLTGTALAAAYADADLLVLPSRAETYGMVVTEALARALPVVATEVGGVPEALGTAADGSRPGLLIKPDDVAALAAALRAWLTDPALRERWRTAARERRETLPTWAETAHRLTEILRSPR